MQRQTYMHVVIVDLHDPINFTPRSHLQSFCYESHCYLLLFAIIHVTCATFINFYRLQVDQNEHDINVLEGALEKVSSLKT